MAFNNSSRTLNAGRNVLSAIINKFVFILLTFVSRKFFIQYIGVEYLGINGLFANVLTLLSMADLGIGTAMNVSLYKPIVNNDTHKLSALLNYYKRLYRYIALSVVLIGLAIIPLLKYIVNMDQDIPYLYLYYIVFVLKNAVSYLFSYKSSILKADQRTYMVTRVDIYLNALKVILQIISIVVFKLYIIYLLLDVAYVLAHNITISYIADKQYPFLKEKAVLTKDEKKDIFSNVSSVFLYKVSRNIVVGSDNIIMSMLVGTIYVGLYSNYHSITHTLDSLIALVFRSFTAGIGNLVATATPQKRYKTFKSLQMISFWICSFVCVCLLYLTQDFIYLWFGSDLLLDNLTLLAIVINMYFSTCMRPVWAFREGTGMYKRIKYITSFTAIINIVLSFVLGKYLGISGILFATSIARLSTYFWYEPKILFKDIFEVNTLEYYFEYVKNILLMVVCAVLCYIPISLINTSIIGWILKLLICTLVVNIAYLLKYYKSEEFRNIREKIIYLLRHTFNKYLH